MRIVQISDTHILCSGGPTAENSERIVEFVNTVLRPDLVIHTGDVVGIDPDDDADRSAGVAILARLKAPLLVVPGNHDVGAGGDDPWMGLAVTSERIARHAEVFGDVPFVERFADWTLVGLNSEVFASALPEEESQWEWLEHELGDADGPPVLVFMHRPMWNHRPTIAADTNSLPVDVRERILSLPGARRIRAVGCGHLHWYASRRRPELLEVWAPSVGFMGPIYGDTQAFNQCGLVTWELEPDSVVTRFRAPFGLDERDPADVPQIAARIRSVRARLGLTVNS